MYTPSLIGKATRVTGTGFQTLSSGNCNVIGVLCAGSATTTGGVQFFQLQATATGTTSGGTAISSVLVFASGSAGQFLSYPAYMSGGCSFNVGAAANPDLTLFWNPA